MKKQHKNDWLFIGVFYIGGFALLAYSVELMQSRPDLAGANLMGAIFGILSCLLATHEIKQ